MNTLTTIVKDNWEWREQIWNLAKFELMKQQRGAVLGWAWFFIKPLIYVFCFWFAIEIGLRAGHTSAGEPPFLLWLTAGIIPWFFMKSMLGTGIDVMHRYSYLVNKVKFPLSAISNVYTLATMIIQLMLQIIVAVVYFLCNPVIDVYLLQVPILLVLMYLFWLTFSILMSPLCAMSKDVKNLMGALNTPFFWLSGVLFNVKSLEIPIVQNVLYFNPITFFVTGFRDALYHKVWFWDDPMLVGGFAVVFVLTFVLALVVHKRTSKEVVDVL